MLENPGAIERHVYRTYWNDGLLDLFSALGVLVIGIFWILDLPVVAACVPALLVPLWGPSRQRFIEPRLGMVEFSDARERRNSNLLKLVLLLGVGSFVLAVGIYFLRGQLDISPSVSLIAGLPAFLLAVLGVLASVLVATRRFLVYSAVLVISGTTGAMSGWQPGQILAIAGLSMLIISVAVLVKFFRENPFASEEAE